MTQNYAVCIYLPETSVHDIETAKAKFGIHILYNEKFDPQLEYSTCFSNYVFPENMGNIYLLFIFSSGNSILANNQDKLAEALEKLKAYRTATLN